jgi:hypothetical protein
MKRIVWTIMVLVAILGCSELTGQSKPRLLAKFPVASLKWIHIAEPVFQREKLDLEKYTVSVTDEADSVTVSLISLDCVEGWKGRGNCGSYSGFVVTVDKKDMHVIRSNYVR